MNEKEHHPDLKQVYILVAYQRVYKQFNKVIRGVKNNDTLVCNLQAPKARLQLFKGPVWN